MGGLEELVVPCVARGNARLLGQRGAAGRRLVGSEVTGGGSRCRGAAGDSGRRLGVAGGRCGAIDGSALYFLVASPPRPPYPPVGVIITAAHCNDASHKGRGRVLRLDASGVVAADLVAAGLPAVATAPRGGPAAETAAATATNATVATADTARTGLAAAVMPALSSDAPLVMTSAFVWSQVAVSVW